MKTSMLGETQRRVLVASWPEAMARGVVDEEGNALFPGDIVRLPAGIRWGTGGDWDVPATVTGFAVGKDGTPSVVVHALAWNGRAIDSWHTWIVGGDLCVRIGEAEGTKLASDIATHAQARGDTPAIVDAATRTFMPQLWMQKVVTGVRTKAGTGIVPGDLLRLPRNVARNRGSQLHAAGLCLGYAIGLDGSPCAVVDAVGEDVPELIRWRTWVVRGNEVIIIETSEAWRLERMYDGRGRIKPRRQGR